MKRIAIDKIDPKYQAYARSIDSPTPKNKQGNVYDQASQLYEAQRKEFYSKNNLQANDTSLVATYDNGIIEGWEYEKLYKKVRADVEQEVAKANFNGESIWDSIFGTKTVQNKKDSLVAQLMKKYIGA